MGITSTFRMMMPVLLAFCVLASGCTDRDKVEGTKQLDAEIAAIRARGEPFALSDFADPAIDPSQNAVELCRQVWKKMNLTNEDTKLLEPADTLPIKPEDTASLDAFLDRVAADLPAIRRAATTSEVSWNSQKIEKPEDLYSIKDVGSLRKMSTICLLDALRATRQGDHRRALDDIEAMFGLARIECKMPAVIANIVASSLEVRAVDALQQILPDLEVKKNMLAAEKAKLLLKLLSSETESTSDYQRQIWGERLNCYIGNDTVLFHHPDDKASQVGRARLLVYFGKLALATNFVEAHAALPAETEHPPALPTGTLYDKKGNQIIASHTALTIDLATKFYFVARANRRLAATALALKLFAAEHGGQLPANLSELIASGYLPSIPIDPLSNHEPVRYLPTLPHPMVYSVGQDMKDDGGSLEMPEKSESFRRMRAKDIVFGLSTPAELMKK